MKIGATLAANGLMLDALRLADGKPFLSPKACYAELGQINRRRRDGAASEASGWMKDYRQSLREEGNLPG